MEIIETDRGARVVLSGELDHHMADRIRPLIDDYVARLRPARLALDFTAVSFMDSSAIGLVMGRYRAVSEYGGRVTLCGLSAHHRRVMRLAGMDRLTEITDGKEESENERKPDETDPAV